MKKLGICAPSRIYDVYPGGRFSMTEMVSYMADVGFDGIDMSFDNISRFGEELDSVLYSVANRAVGKNISLSSCHLPFYMPDPDGDLMPGFAAQLKRGIDAAARMGIELAVTHPVAYHSSKHSHEDWLRKNIEFFTPIVEYASKKRVVLCIENMASAKESPADHLYGCRANEILTLAELFGCMTCWDFGHANLSGLCQSKELAVLDGRLGIVHIHDNNGKRDTHSLPFDGGIDWEDAMLGLKNVGYGGAFDVEVKASELPRDRDVRNEFGRLALARAERLVGMIY